MESGFAHRERKEPKRTVLAFDWSSWVEGCGSTNDSKWQAYLACQLDISGFFYFVLTWVSINLELTYSADFYTQLSLPTRSW